MRDPWKWKFAVVGPRFDGNNFHGKMLWMRRKVAPKIFVLPMAKRCWSIITYKYKYLDFSKDVVKYNSIELFFIS